MTEEFRPTRIRRTACANLAGRWTDGATLAAVYILVLFACLLLQGVSVAFCYAAVLFVLSAVSIGCRWAFLDVSRGDAVFVGRLFTPFGNYRRVEAAYLLVVLAAALGLVLFIVPGIILSLGFSMTFFILRDDAEVSAIGAMKRSWAMMRGHKWEYLLLMLSFLGWALLAAITVVGILWLIPYVQTAAAEFYVRTLRRFTPMSDVEEI